MRFQLKQYDSEAVVFDTASGDTHYLAPLALVLFQLCQDSPGASRDEFRHWVTQRLSLEPSALLDAQIDETLDSLRRIGLISLE